MKRWNDHETYSKTVTEGLVLVQRAGTVIDVWNNIKIITRKRYQKLFKLSFPIISECGNNLYSPNREVRAAMPFEREATLSPGVLPTLPPLEHILSPFNSNENLFNPYGDLPNFHNVAHFTGGENAKIHVFPWMVGFSYKFMKINFMNILGTFSCWCLVFFFSHAGTDWELWCYWDQLVLRWSVDQRAMGSFCCPLLLIQVSQLSWKIFKISNVMKITDKLLKIGKTPTLYADKVSFQKQAFSSCCNISVSTHKKGLLECW